jgi:hypothetical protein
MTFPTIPDLTVSIKPLLKRTEWGQFPDVIIHAEEVAVKKHPAYKAAKGGDSDAAETLILETVPIGALDKIGVILENKKVHLLAVHALETEGVNAIPKVFARILSKMLDLPISRGIIQINRVSHTGASGYHRLASPALFGGEVREMEYYIVDDFIGQGGTLTNLKGYVEGCGAKIIGATTLTGKHYSAKLKPEVETLRQLREKHGNEFEKWWDDTFGYRFERLTESEARYLIRADDAHSITTRIAAAFGDRN